MPSMSKQTNRGHENWGMRICANKTCGHGFYVTEDIRQKYCSKSCQHNEADRRRNQRRAAAGDIRRVPVMHANARSWSDGVIAASRLARGTSIETTPRAILFTPAIQEETMVMILDEFKNKPEEDLIVALEKQQALEAEIRSLRAKVVEKHDIRFSELTDFMNQYKINKLNRR